MQWKDDTRKKIDILLILEHTIAQDNSLYLFIHHVWLEEGGSFQDFLFNAKAWLFHNIRTFEGLLNWICKFKFHYISLETKIAKK